MTKRKISANIRTTLADGTVTDTEPSGKRGK